MGRSGTLFVLCVGQQGGSFGIVGLGREGRTLGKGVGVHHIQRQQGFDALGVLRLEQTGQHPPGVGLEEVPVGIPGASLSCHGQRRRSKQSIAITEASSASWPCGKMASYSAREKLIFEKALPVVVALPRKGVEQDVGGRLLDVLPVGGIPQPRTGCGLPHRPEQRPHGLGDAAHEGKQAGGLLGRGADDEVFQRKAVEKDIAAHGQLSCPGSQAAQLRQL